jgi:hypothetical protein
LCGKILHVQKRPFPSNVSQAKAKVEAKAKAKPSQAKPSQARLKALLNSQQIGAPAALNLDLV